MIAKKHIYGRRPLPPNTFIGGVGSTLSTKNLLAAKLGIASTRIKSFRIINDEVQAYITKTYTLNNGFKDDTTITYFKDEAGLIVACNGLAFNNCSNLEEVRFPNCTSFTGNGNDTSGIFWNCVKLSILHVPSLTSITGYNTFRNTPLLKNINLDNLVVGLNVRSFNGCGVTNLNLPSLTTAGQEAFGNSPFPSTLSVPLLSNTSPRVFSSLPVKILNLPSLVNVINKQSFFKGMSAVDIIDAKKLKVFGNPNDTGGGVNDTPTFRAFTETKLNFTINVHIDLLTINSGTPDVALLWAKNNRNAKVNFYDDNGNYVSTL